MCSRLVRRTILIQMLPRWLVSWSLNSVFSIWINFCQYLSKHSTEKYKGQSRAICQWLVSTVDIQVDCRLLTQMAVQLINWFHHFSYFNDIHSSWRAIKSFLFSGDNIMELYVLHNIWEYRMIINSRDFVYKDGAYSNELHVAQVFATYDARRMTTWLRKRTI